ncbi:MAG: aminotransferase class I/II-fold pyridoxal phosphate-dependent enzyme [candidate division Zixibacteria bacterium]|nr:aminotransferase class I/II-fold pyridoxal phosphate-dependent enzyme [candidate division Zixibacteria bacterium]
MSDDTLIHTEGDFDLPMSRRAFLAGAALGGVGLLTGAHETAAWMAGRQPADVKGIGVPAGLVRLAFNENPLGASPKAIAAVLERQTWMNRYDYTTTLQKAIIKYHGLDIPNVSGFDFKATGERHGILLGVGTTELLQLLALEALMGKGEAVEALPAYGQITRVGDELREAGYPVLTRQVAVKPDGTHDLDAMQALITDRTGLVIVNNPHNPTGAINPYADVLRFIDNVPSRVLVVIDEVYIHFVRDPAYKDFIDIAKERENVLVLRTFSKAYGLGGLRVGYAVGHRNVVRRLAPFSMGLLGRNTLSVYAAAAALEDAEHVRRSQQTVWSGNDYLTGELKKMGVSVVPSHANFVWVDCKRRTRDIVRALSAKNVLIRGGEGAWESPNHIRVSTGSPEENEAFIHALQQVLA